jgi:hypothetical protein
VTELDDAKRISWRHLVTILGSRDLAERLVRRFGGHRIPRLPCREVEDLQADIRSGIDAGESYTEVAARVRRSPRWVKEVAKRPGYK